MSLLFISFLIISIQDNNCPDEKHLLQLCFKNKEKLAQIARLTIPSLWRR